MVAPNLRNFPLKAPCGDARDGVVRRPVKVGALFAPTQGLHFRTLHPLSFLLICALHWCKHCTGIQVAPNLRAVSLMALCGAAGDGVVLRPVQVDALFVPTQGLHFRAVRPLSFLFICTLHGANILPG